MLEAVAMEFLSASKVKEVQILPMMGCMRLLSISSC